MHTASSDWSLQSPLAQAPFRNRRGLRRLVAFGAVSLALHALTFGSYHPGAGVDHAPGRAPHPVLHAVLAPRAPAPLQLDASPAPAPLQDSSPTPPAPDPLPSPTESGPRGTIPIPIAERWYGPTEVDTRAEPLTVVQPDYPAALAGGLAVPATVRLRLYIDERGAVRKMEVERSGPRAEFDDAALRAWERVRFTPATREGQPVKSQKLIELDFVPY